MWCPKVAELILEQRTSGTEGKRGLDGGCKCVYVCEGGREGGRVRGRRGRMEGIGRVRFDFEGE